MWPMLIMSAGKAMSDMGNENRDRQLAAATQRYSPWTGLKAQPVQRANPVGDMAQGYAGYLGQKQNDENQAMNLKLKQAQIDALGRGGNPYSSLQSGQGSYYGTPNWGNY